MRQLAPRIGLLDLVVCKDWFKGSRPFVVVALPEHLETSAAILALTTSVKYFGDGTVKPLQPGWLSMPKVEREGDLESYLQPTVLYCVSIEKIEGRDNKRLPDQYREMIQACLKSSIQTGTPEPRQIPDGFVKQLSPPGSRWLDYENIGTVLKSTRWVAPSQGDVVCMPEWWRESSDRLFLVISSTSFNQRYHYPEVLTVPLRPASQVRPVTSLARWTSFELPTLSEEPLMAIHEGVNTFNFSTQLFEPCGRCYDLKDRPQKYRLPAVLGGACIRCDRANAPWPMYFHDDSSKHIQSVSRVLLSVRKLFGIR